jgi:hypothetical protein
MPKRQHKKSCLPCGVIETGIFSDALIKIIDDWVLQ